MTAPCYCGGGETTGHAVGCPSPVAPSIMVEPKVGFFVWTKTGKSPAFCHDTLVRAQAEADRLAAKHPGAKFIVMSAVSKHSVAKPTPARPDSREGCLPSPSRHEGARP